MSFISSHIKKKQSDNVWVIHIIQLFYRTKFVGTEFIYNTLVSYREISLNRTPSGKRRSLGFWKVPVFQANCNSDVKYVSLCFTLKTESSMCTLGSHYSYPRAPCTHVNEKTRCDSFQWRQSQASHDLHLTPAWCDIPLTVFIRPYCSLCVRLPILHLRPSDMFKKKLDWRIAQLLLLTPSSGLSFYQTLRKS